MANIAFQWSSRGQDVHLIDAQPNQLQASLQAIDKFRASLKPKGAQWGKIITHLPDTREAALQNAWLVIEVSSKLLSSKSRY